MTDAKRSGLFVETNNLMTSASYVARLDDLARVLVRMLGDVPVDHLSFRDGRRLNRLIDRMITAVSRPELLLALSDSK